MPSCVNHVYAPCREGGCHPCIHSAVAAPEKSGFMPCYPLKISRNLIFMKRNIVQIISLSIPLLLPLSGSGAELGTRQRTITPVAVTNAPVPPIYPSAVSNYAVYGYSSWQWGPGEDEGQQLTNMPAGYTRATNAARLLSFLSISDAHITDKESPCQGIFDAYQGGAGVNPSPYSPVMLYTTQVLDAAVRTANAVNRLTPFDFAISLGDPANGPQYNELRWFIDVMDGKYITPSSGTNAGAATIDYQKPFQAAGLDPAIPWYAVLGNHDHFWLGGLPTEVFQKSYTNADGFGDNRRDWPELAIQFLFESNLFRRGRSLKTVDG